jgi:hypothetical protein
LNAYGERLNIAVQSHAILRKATLGILTEARKLQPPTDPEATQVHGEISQLMRGASAPLDLKEPEPPWATMSDAELREYTRKNFGF